MEEKLKKTTGGGKKKQSKNPQKLTKIITFKGKIFKHSSEIAGVKRTLISKLVLILQTNLNSHKKPTY